MFLSGAVNIVFLFPVLTVSKLIKMQLGCLGHIQYFPQKDIQAI